MVSLAAGIADCSYRLIAAVVMAAEKSQLLFFKLDDDNRARVIAGLFALALVGVGLVALAMAGGRMALRRARKSHGPTRTSEQDWYRKPLVPKDTGASARDVE